MKTANAHGESDPGDNQPQVPILRPILVTGAHRSGKTFCSRGLCVSGKLSRISEPLNPRTRPGVGGLNPKYAFQFITDRSNGQLLKDEFQKVLRYDYRLAEEVRQCESPKDYLRMARDIPLTLTKKVLNRRPLVDDPFAIMSADWFCTNFDMDVIVMIRHPASFISSLIAQNYGFDFSNLLDQHELIDERLKAFEKEIVSHCQREHTLIEQGVLLWRIIYRVVLDYRERFGNTWMFVRFEDLIEEPIDEFRFLYEKAGLPFDDRTEGRILKLLESPRQSEIRRENNEEHIPKYARPIDMQKKYYRLKLSERDVGRIRELSEDVWPLFYDETDW